MVLMVEQNHGEHLICRFARGGNELDPRDVKIANLKQRIQELEGNHGFHDDHYDNPWLKNETKSEPIIWDIGDEEEEYPFVNKYPSFQEESFVLVEDESCPIYYTDNEEEESMPVYDTDIEDVIEEEEGFIPQVFLVDYYFKNLCCVDSDEEVTSMYKSHEKAKNDVSTMSLEEFIAWEKKETQSSSYLRSPHVWKKTSVSTSKSKVLLDDFDDVGMEKVRASYKSDEMVIEVYFGSCFFICPLDYPVRQILDLRLPRSTRMPYKEMADLLLDKTKDEIWKWFYCKPKFILPDLYFKPLEVVCESDEEVISKYRSQEKARKDSSTMSLEELIAWEQKQEPNKAPLRLSNISNTRLLQTQEMYVDEKATRIIPGPAGIFQMDRIHKLNNFNDAPTQEYIRKLIDDVSEADDFKRRPWITVLEFINDNGEIEGGCFSDIKSYLKNGKLDKVVAIVTLCKPYVIDGMNVTLKDPSSTMAGTIHYKVLLKDDYAKAIKVGFALILHNVYVFCPKPSIYCLNITIKNLVKIFQKDANCASSSNV
nr:hypothetical protein [Tanacetum cinerariifolium]